MPSSSDIQKSIDSLNSSRQDWNRELLDLNRKLSEAKKLTEKRKLSIAVKNAEEQIKDIDKQVNKLQNDLKKQNILESDKQSKFDKFLDTAKDITTKMVDSGKLDSLAEKTRGTGAQNQFNDETFGTNETPNDNKTTLDKKWIYIGIGALLLIFITSRK